MHAIDHTWNSILDNMDVQCHIKSTISTKGALGDMRAVLCYMGAL